MDALYKFRNLCSLIPEPTLRHLFEQWLVANVSTFQVEARISRESERFDKAMEYEQERTLQKLIHGLVESSQRYEKKEWLQGDKKIGSIITRRIDILGRPKN